MLELLGLKVKFPLGAMVTGPVRFIVVEEREPPADITILPVPVKVPPFGPETLKELLITEAVPLSLEKKLPEVAVAVGK